MAHLEADIEFPDEDLNEGWADFVSREITPVVKALAAEIRTHLDDGRRGERLRGGIHVAVIGAPNAGKSTLVNALAQRDVAIVSDIAGTTRDVIEVHLDLGGYPVILSDTAGLRPDQIGAEGQDSIESEGIRRALKRAEDADIRLLVFDGTAQGPDLHTKALEGGKRHHRHQQGGLRDKRKRAANLRQNRRGHGQFDQGPDGESRHTGCAL